MPRDDKPPSQPQHTYDDEPPLPQVHAMTVLQITIQQGSGAVRTVVIEHSRPDSLSPIRKEGELRLDDDDLRRLLPLEIDPHAYGTALGEALFSGRTQLAFLQARSRSRDALRVRLCVEDKELQRLYWGRLCAPTDDDAWDFLALDQLATFALYLPSSTDRAFRPIGQRDLAALLVVAAPENLNAHGLATFDAAATVSGLRTALGEIPCEVLAPTPDAAGPPTLDELCRRLGERQHTLLHVVAHGKVVDGEVYLALSNPYRQVELVAGETLIRELRRLKQLPHLVFLATCHSAAPTPRLGSLAQRLVTQLGVPATIAMTDAVSIATAEALAAAFYSQLRASGEPDDALARAATGLSRRSDITVPTLYSRLGDRPLFGDTVDRELTRLEIALGLERLAALLPERAPILKSTFDEHAAVLKRLLPARSDSLDKAAQSEWDAAWATACMICDEVLEINFRAFALGDKPPVYDARCPFPDLLAFGARFAATGRPEDDDRVFFKGRDALVDQLMRRFDEHRFVPVLGSSGCGKSSVVLAGLAYRLETERCLRMIYMTPGSDPVAQLDARLAGLSDQSQAFLVVDQFEELFTLVDRDERRRSFVDRLLSLAGHLPIVITMRADFLGDCAPYANLEEALVPTMKLVAPMTTAELRSAMEQQAAEVGLCFEANLSNTILDAVKNEPGAMPLLQHLLNELWQRRHGRWLMGGEYDAIGGIRQSIARTADRFYDGLAQVDKDQVRDIFLRLTRLDEDAVQGEERRDSRRRVALEELVAPERSIEGTKALVKRLADSRLAVVSINEVTHQEEVEVAHEALIRYWPTLQSWIDADRSLLRLREGVRRAAAEWEESQRHESYLVHRGIRLQKAQALRTHPRITLNEREMGYLSACIDAEADAQSAPVGMPSRAIRRPARAAIRPIGTEFIDWNQLVDRIARGRCVPVLGNWLDLELAVRIREDELARSFAAEIQYPRLGPHRLASLTDYARTMGGGGYHRANSKLLAFLKGAIYVQALDSNPYDPDRLAEVEAEIDRVTVTEFARRLGFPIDDRLPDPLQVLANLPFEIILTTSPFTFVEDALRRAGKDPRAEFCRWTVGLQAVPWAVEDDYQPSSAKPLVYHLMGLDSFPESLVLSEDDALDYLMAVAERPEVVPPDVWKAVASSSLLLLGHSLDSLGWRTLEHAILSGRSAPESVFQLVPHQDTARSKLIDSYLRRAGLMPYWETPGSILGRIWEMYQRG